MRIAYFDCIAGASGDMILGALVDAGLSIETLQEHLSALRLGDEFELQVHKVSKSGFGATKVDLIVHEHEHPYDRPLAEIEAVIRASGLPEHIQQKAIDVFRRLAEVEAGIHGTRLETVHLHELGAVDTIVDITGALVGLEALGVDLVVGSPLPLG